jgi:sugar (pentulose or hexulose) kinase
VANQPLLMGIDLGTSSVKVLFTSIDGQIAGAGAAEYGTILPIDRYLDRATGA